MISDRKKGLYLNTQSRRQIYNVHEDGETLQKDSYHNIMIIMRQNEDY